MKDRKSRQSKLPPLRRVVCQVFILAAKENVDALIVALESEKFVVKVHRALYSDVESQYPKNSKTFIGHRQIWEMAASATGYTLICESDFVPCKGLGGFPVFWPLDDELAWGYLYQGSPRLFTLVGSQPWLRGHCAPLVAYVVSPKVATLMLRFFQEETQLRSLTEYFTFDAHLQWSVMKMGAKAYIPMRHYGEHGGIPNKEHARLGSLSRAGEHRADNLQRRLHFLPPYAQGSRLAYWRIRAFNRVLGWLRLFCGKWIYKTDLYENTSSDKLRMFCTGVMRLIK